MAFSLSIFANSQGLPVLKVYVTEFFTPLPSHLAVSVCLGEELVHHTLLSNAPPLTGRAPTHLAASSQLFQAKQLMPTVSTQGRRQWDVVA